MCKDVYALKLKETAPIKKITDLMLEVLPKGIIVTCDKEQLSMEVDLDHPHCVYFEHDEDLDIGDQYLVDNVVFKILEKYGLEKVIDPSTSVKRHALHYAHDIINFVVSEYDYDELLKLDKCDSFYVWKESGKLLTDEEIEVLENRVDNLDIEDEEQEDDAIHEIYKDCILYDYFYVVTDKSKYEDYYDKPKIFTYFWNKRKAAFESELKSAVNRFSEFSYRI